MSHSGFDYHRRPKPRAAIAAIAVVLFVLVTGGAWALREALRRAELAPLDDGLRVLLTVEPFEIGDSVPDDWNASDFADSLAAQLSLIRGIEAASHSSNARYVLRGHVTLKDGRLILATRLGRDGEPDTVWTATFWRSATTGSTVLTDLAQAVAEAVFNQSAREPFSQKREKP